MKRQLILIRHTKSSWGDLSQPDFDRPIKKDRADDAKNMAAHLKTLKIQPDLIICSPAKRTRQTVEYFCDKLKYDIDNVQFDKRLYESSEDDVFAVIRETDSKVKVLTVVSHNPTLTHFANFFLSEKVDEVPTTGVVWLEFNTDDWELSRTTPAATKGFFTPKTI